MTGYVPAARVLAVWQFVAGSVVTHNVDPPEAKVTVPVAPAGRPEAESVSCAPKTIGAGAGRSPSFAAAGRPPTATGISITRRWNGTTMPPLYSSSYFSPTISTGSSTRDTSPTYRREIQISSPFPQFTTRISLQLAFLYNHSLCSTPTIGG